jgi:hypothetical protein
MNIEEANAQLKFSPYEIGSMIGADDFVVIEYEAYRVSKLGSFDTVEEALKYGLAEYEHLKAAKLRTIDDTIAILQLQACSIDTYDFNQDI